MKIGMIGLGRMGANMARRLMRAGHACVVYDRDAAAVQALAKDGAAGAADLAELMAKLPLPRVVWIMVPAGIVDELLQSLATAGLAAGDIVIDGGNSHYADDIRRAQELEKKGVHYVDVGTSGGLWGLERGYCLMAGGQPEIVKHIEPILATLAPGGAPTASTAARGYLHCGGNGAGHFVKMVHNGIEYGLMAAYAEGFNLLHHISTGSSTEHPVDAETAPIRRPQMHDYNFKLEEVAELWRHGSVISSWLLDLTAAKLAENPKLDEFAGRVSDSGEGRWTVQAAIEAGVPLPVLSIALYERFTSRGEAEFADRLLSAMRLGFGGHHETAPGTK